MCSGCNSTTTTCSNCGCQIGGQRLSWNNIFGVPNYLDEGNAVQTIQKTLTSAQILTLNSSPVEVIPFPDSSLKFIDVVSAYAIITYNSVQYSNVTANRLVLTYNGATDEIFGLTGDFVAENATTRARFIQKESGDNLRLNASIQAKILNANPTLGNSQITIVVNYRTITLT